MPFVRRVRWLRVLAVGLSALVGFLSFRLWQWMDYGWRQAERADHQTAQLEEVERECDRLERELKDARVLVHGRYDERPWSGKEARWAHRPAHERLEQILSVEYVPDELLAFPSTQEEIRLLWQRLAGHRARPR